MGVLSTAQEGIQRRPGVHRNNQARRKGVKTRPSKARWCRFLAIDTEACGSDAVKPRNPDTHLTHISWWNERGQGDSRPFKVSKCHPSWKNEAEWNPNSNVAKALRDPRTIKLFWNAKYDLAILRKAGIEIRGPIIDVMILGRIVHTAERTGSYTLKHFTRKFLSITYKEETKLKQWCVSQKRKKLPCAYGDAPLHILHPYSILDAQATFELFWLMKEQLTPASIRLLAKEHKVLAATIKMENRGMMIDEDLVLRLIDKCNKEMRRTKSKY